MIPFDPIELLARLEWTENDDLEFKSAKGGLPQSLWETYSAMANTHGGVIVLGVENDGRISGLENVVKLKKALWDTINNRSKVSANLLRDTDVAEAVYDERRVLAIRVPRASRFQRPIYLGHNPLLGTYRRNFEGDYHCTEQEVSRMLSDRAEEPADSRILEHFTLEDLDRRSLQQYRQRFASHKPTHPWLSEDDQGLLSKLGAWRRDRATGLVGVSVAGLLMFGTDEAIREAVPGYQVDYRERLSADPDMRWTDRITMDGTWHANLFQFYLRVIQRLAQDLPLPFQLENDLFRKGETVVHEAIREALVNALIHSDYQGQGGIIVERYPDRFDLSNPGSLLVSLDQLLRGNVSECRNKSLQTMFMMIGVAEKAGSGVDKIRRGWESQHWRSPIVREQFQPDRVEWILPMISLLPQQSLEHLRSLFGGQLDRFAPQEVQALVTADLEGTVDNARMRQMSGDHATDVTRLLQGLVSKGALVQEGQGRWTRYRLPVGPDSQRGSVYTAGGSVHKGDGSVHKGDGSVHKSHNSAPTANGYVYSDDGHEQTVDGLLGGFPEDIRGMLLSIAAPARQNRRLPPREMEDLIRRLCTGRWLTRRQLAELLDRNQDGLRSRFLTSMVEHGVLRLRFPNKPNRADQAYTTAEEGP